MSKLLETARQKGLHIAALSLTHRWLLTSAWDKVFNFRAASLTPLCLQLLCMPKDTALT